jgi:hypothetical protein
MSHTKEKHMAKKVLKKYKVKVCRISYAHRDLEVEATNIREARQKALDEAGNYEFSEHDADYKVEGIYLF